MSKTGSIIDLLMKTIGDVQTSNKNNPKAQTADSNIFDLLRDKVKQIDDKSRDNRVAKGKSPYSVLDLIKKEIEGVRKQNKNDPNVETAPKDIFKDILRKVGGKPKKKAAKGIGRIITEYNLNITNLPNNVVKQIQSKYLQDQKNLDKQYAQAIYDLVNQNK